MEDVTDWTGSEYTIFLFIEVSGHSHWKIYRSRDTLSSYEEEP